MTSLEVLRVGAWKSAKGLGWLTLNTEEDFEMVTKEAMDCIRQWRGAAVIGLDDDNGWIRWRETARSAIGSNFEPKSGLMRLEGVGYSMASALLCILEPNVWPVIDKRGVQTVFGKRPDGRLLDTGRWQRAVAYCAYARHLATKGSTHWPQAVTMHELDLAAMGASMPETKTRPAGVVPPGWRPATCPN